MIVNGLTLRVLRNTSLSDAMEKLFQGEIKSEGEKATLLKIAVLLLNSNDRFVKDLGYRIVLQVCLLTRNFVPLYDIAAQFGYTPVIELLRRQDFVSERDTFLSSFSAAYRAGFAYGDTFQTEEQRALFESFVSSIEQSIAVIAPTSYGKSELIEILVQKSKTNLAIVVPSKALVSQTRRRVVNALQTDSPYQIVAHHDSVFSIGKPILAIVTQERLLRIFQRYPSLEFPTLVVDEAHNLLNDDRRARLLGSVIIIAKARTQKVAIKYLTPFLVSSENLRSVGDLSAEVPEVRVEERLKSENYKVCDTTADGTIELYDQFLDKFYTAPTLARFTNPYDLLASLKKNKNIVYLNKPRHIEELALRLSRKLPAVLSEELERICVEISEFVHPQYKILDCLRKGVAYHHGSVPDVVRSYIETAFRKIAPLDWIVTSSTLLEGVNVPAQTLFVLDPRKGLSTLSQAQFRNLVGRVNRFSEIFDFNNGSPHLLSPEIIVVKCAFSRADLSVKNFIKNVVKADKKIADVIDNPLLQNADLDEDGIRKRLEDFTIIENIEPNFNFNQKKRIATTSFGASCFADNIFEVDIIKHEETIDEKIEHLRASPLIDDATSLLDNIHEIFNKYLREDLAGKEKFSLQRLENEEARRFYSMFFDWRINQSNYQKMIGNFLAYWKKKLAIGADALIYAGKWGVAQREGIGAPNYIDISSASEYELINLAIVRIKEEQDFIDNNIVKFVEVLNDMGLLTSSLYNKIKYGTDDPKRIILIRSGLSHIAAHILSEKYAAAVHIGPDETVQISSAIHRMFAERKEKELIIFEVESSGLIRE